MEATFRRQGSWCTEHIRSVKNQVTTGECCNWLLSILCVQCAHIRSNESHYLMAGFFIYWTYKVKKKTSFNGEQGYYRVVLLEVTLYSKMMLLFIQSVLCLWLLCILRELHI